MSTKILTTKTLRQIRNRRAFIDKSEITACTMYTGNLNQYMLVWWENKLSRYLYVNLGWTERGWQVKRAEKKKMKVVFENNRAARWSMFEIGLKRINQKWLFCSQTCLSFPKKLPNFWCWLQKASWTKGRPSPISHPSEYKCIAWFSYAIKYEKGL